MMRRSAMDAGTTDWLPGPILTLLLAGVLAAGGSGAASTPGGPTRPSFGPAPVCPLTPPQEATAVLAFEDMIPVIRHPRCMNCHGGVNPLVPYAQGRHMGGLIDTTQIPNSSVQTIRKVCEQCHAQLPGWDTPGAPMFWVGKTDKQICMQFKQFSTDPADFIAHITDDRGGVAFIDAAFIGERALDDDSKTYGANYGKPFAVDPPPGTHADLIRQGTQWANTVGPKGWNAAPDCGCEIHRDGWVGTAHFAMTVPGSGYSVEEEATATVWFERDKALSKGQDVYWKSAAGSIKWSTKYTGACHGTFTGTTPINLTASGVGGDGSPLGVIELTSRGNQVLYFVSNAPWLDQFQPVTNVPCDGVGSLPVPLPLHASFWWQHDPNGGVVSPDGQLLEGSYQQTAGPSTMEWKWSFRRTAP